MKLPEIKLQKLLVLVDAKDQRSFSFNFAKTLNNSNENCEIQFLGFADELPFYTQFPSAQRHEQIQKLIVDNAKRKIEKQCEDQFGKIFHVDIQIGNSLKTILEYIEAYEPDLLIKNEYHLDSQFLRKNTTSGLDLKLARHCPVPLLLMDTELTEQTSVGCAVAPESSDLTADLLCDKIMIFGIFFANLLGSNLYAIRAWKVFGETDLWSSGQLSSVQMQEHIESIRKPSWQLFDKLISKFRKKAKNAICSEFHKGEATLVINQTIIQQKIGLLVIGSLARSGIEGYFIGNTAEEIIQSASCSVLILRPEVRRDQ